MKKLNKIRSAKGLQSLLDGLYRGGVKYYLDQPNTVFTYQGKEVAKWLYDEQKAVFLDKNIDLEEL